MKESIRSWRVGAGTVIKVKACKCVLYLTDQEVLELLKHDTKIWTKALKRGKAITRSKQQEQRTRT